MSKPSQKQSTNSTTNATFTGQNRAYAPDWISNAVQGITGKVGALGAQDPNSFVAGSNTNLNLAGANAQNLSGLPWNFDGAVDLTRSIGQADSPDIASMTRSFMNPYLKDVVGATSADLDHSDNIARQQSDLANPGAFGGSGIALTKSAMEDALSRARGTTLGNLRSHGYETALGGATSQAGVNQNQEQLRLAAANQLGGLSTAYDANNRANIGTQLGVGAAQRGVTQDQLSAPLNLTTWQSQTLPQLLQSYFGSDSSGTQNSTQVGTQSGSSNPGAMSTAGDIAMIASLFMSDERLKRDVQKVGELANGLGLYLYRYVWGPARFIGVMAQEVLKIRPGAVRTRPDGYLEVDYAALA